MSDDTRAHLVQLLTDAARVFVEIAHRHGFEGIPEATFERRYFGAPGGVDESRTERSLEPVWEQVRRQVIASTEVDRLSDFASGFAKPLLRGRVAATITSDSYGPILVNDYIMTRGEFAVEVELIERVVDAFIEEVKAKRARWRAFVSLSGFSADHPFDLADGVHIRPINDADLDSLARVGPFTDRMPQINRTDWLCEIERDVSIETYEEVNSSFGLVDLVVTSLTLTKGGRATFKHLQSGVTLRFLPEGHIGGRGPTIMSGTTGDVSFSVADIATAQENYRLVDRVQTDNSAEPLRLPLRRLRTASERASDEDRVVDHVIGLERLLAPDTVTLEVTYRFRLRGAALLPNRFGDVELRMKKMADLYDLRSKIVHGSADPVKIRETVSFSEEALRVMWIWFAKRLPQNPRELVARLDQELVGGGSAWSA